MEWQLIAPSVRHFSDLKWLHCCVMVLLVCHGKVAHILHDSIFLFYTHLSSHVSRHICNHFYQSLHVCDVHCVVSSLLLISIHRLNLLLPKRALEAGQFPRGMGWWSSDQLQRGGQVLFYLQMTLLSNIKQNITKEVCGLYVEGEEIIIV